MEYSNLQRQAASLKKNLFDQVYVRIGPVNGVFPFYSSVAVYLPIYYVPQEQITLEAMQLYFSILSIYSYPVISSVHH